ncbi:Transcriptional regulator MraZ [Candidatus Desulfarcum epimagneticum]|uniref:Transcriptional regulator MraZ n=1 Tax=uncultured Desulfobacteraceae bacterium TaxID=218296 RepID=A0A484HQV8_9BACT|nr:Transcriptional regulator MraZ [uncultured Desulfobacteraceae bacterium]
MFRGTSYNTLDPKGRFIMPSRFRGLMESGKNDALMITRLDGALFAYTLDEWSAVESRILQEPTTSAALRRFRRIFIGGAAQCAKDKQGRVLIPVPMREYAHLKKDIVIVGQINHFEIWSKKRYEAEEKKLDEDMGREDVGDEIAKFGL